MCFMGVFERRACSEKKGQLCTGHPPDMHQMKSNSPVLVDNLVDEGVALPHDLGYTS
jgi:hypothetical protein